MAATSVRLANMRFRYQRRIGPPTTDSIRMQMRGAGERRRYSTVKYDWSINNNNMGRAIM